jgi:serine-type D-Ala-D-Ala carboxypeptidase (penicillin-binding protein 5/6)
MKTLALAITLVLHTTGLWSHVPNGARASLTAAATTSTLKPVPTVVLEEATVGPLPIRIATDPLDLDAAGAIAVDTATGTVLYAKDQSTHRPIASVTKLTTALVVMSRHDPAESIKVPALPTYQQADETIGLVPGESYRLGDLVRAALVPSANDAADALAIADAGSIPKFAALMNAKMTQWGISGTRFSSASGLQDKDNYASAEALAKIARLALVNPFIRESVGLTDITFTGSSGRIFNLKTTNQLLATSGFYGIKTGYTPGAGECFVGLTRINGHEVITVVLGSTNRFGATVTLTNWISHNWQWL